ncbi:MAG: N-acetylmuramoyl-L-alanine amidase [Nitrospirota bacterium]|nr:N-acetylmuramoyl-L-alanine amidase [Nitrospirota bacterium]
MKITLLSLIILLFLSNISNSETYPLKLRASRQPESVRIVIEGHSSAISRAQVLRREEGIAVTFPETSFTVQPEKIIVDHKLTDNDTIMFYPGAFRDLKFFLMKYPDRLVIDAYLKEGANASAPPASGSVEEQKKVLSKIRAVIDPGHGGYESGLVSDRYSEKNVVLDIARKLSALINKGASRASLTRGSDRFMSLPERLKLSNAADTDIYISLHIGRHAGVVFYVPVITEHVSDIAGNFLAARGQEKYTDNTLTLLYAMKEAVKDNFSEDMVSVRPLPYGILSQIEAAALIIELPSFEDAVYAEGFMEEMANTLYKGIYIYEEIRSR